MTDTPLSGVELAEAVARAMGLTGIDVILVDDRGQAVPGRRPLDQLQFTDVIRWDPTKGGDAGAEVHDWLTRECAESDVSIGLDHSDLSGWCYTLEGGAREPIEEIGPTVWIALCRAVVAWDER